MTRADDLRTVSGREEDVSVADVPNYDVTAHVPSPDRTVFTETGNSDGWIATDTTVELRR